MTQENLSIKDQKKANKKAAKDFLRESLNRPLPEQADELTAFILEMRKALQVFFGGGPKKVLGTLGAIHALFMENDRIDEMELFKQLRIGRNEMRKRARQLIKDVEPEQRIWAEFDVESEAWIVRGRGVEAPAGWIGYRPAM